MRPSASAYVRSGLAGPAIVAQESGRLAMEHSNPSNAAPLVAPLSTAFCFSSFRTASPRSSGRAMAGQPEAGDKDGLDSPTTCPSAGAQSSDAFPGHGAIEADADRQIRHRWIIRGRLK